MQLAITGAAHTNCL